MKTRKSKPKAGDVRDVHINGEPYRLERNAAGWAVTPTSSPTDRFHRSYQVYVSPLTRRPVKCTCPQNVERRVECKHMARVAALTLAMDREEALARVCEAGRTVAAEARTDESLVPLWDALKQCYTAVRGAKDLGAARAALAAARARVAAYPALARLLDLARVLLG